MRLNSELMRRHDKAAIRLSEIINILNNGKVCRLAMIDDGKPYLVPLSYGYADETLYFHSAHQGRKISILRQNPRVWFEITIDTAIKDAPKPCDWGITFQSVMGDGEVKWLESEDEKITALSIIMEQQAGAKPNQPFTFSPKALARTTVFKVLINTISGKKAA